MYVESFTGIFSNWADGLENEILEFFLFFLKIHLSFIEKPNNDKDF